MSNPSSPKTAKGAKLVTGSTMRHVMVMTMTATVGLMALFLVDLADLYFLGLLGEDQVAGAIGYAGAIVYFNLSVCIGISIAASALVARALGAKREERARRLSTNTCLIGFVLTTLLAVFLWFYAGDLTALLGARGAAQIHAVTYLKIVIPAFPILVVGVCMNGILRGSGDAKRAMYCTLSGGITNAVLDPIFIFGLDMGVSGAALASVFARLAVFIVGLYCVVRIHNSLGPTSWRKLRSDTKTILSIAAPAVLTNIATPVGQAYVTSAIAAFGTGWVAGFAVISKIVPIAFGIVFALSGAVGPIIGQNYGAQQYDRVKRSYRDALALNTVYVATVCVLLILARNQIAMLFNASPEAHQLIVLFCLFASFSFMFNGAQFIANAAFNNLRRPHYSALLNWGKATVGTIPFAMIGAAYFGAPGVLYGQAVGTVLFGTAAGAAGYRLISRLSQKHAQRQPPGGLPARSSIKDSA